jgi:hypothetical protein
MFRCLSLSRENEKQDKEEMVKKEVFVFDVTAPVMKLGYMPFCPPAGNPRPKFELL